MILFKFSSFSFWRFSAFLASSTALIPLFLSIESRNLSIASVKISFLSVNLSIVRFTSFAFPLTPNKLLKPPNDIVLRILPIPLTKDPPICVIKSPLRIFFNIPLTAFRTVSIKLLINVPIPSFKTSSIFKMAATIWPISPAFDNPSLSASPAFLPASAAASAASLPISFRPSAAFLASSKAFNPSIPPLSWSKLSQRDAKSDSPEVERNSWIAEIGCVTFCVVCANF